MTAVGGCMARVRTTDASTQCYVHAFGHEPFRAPVMTYTGPTQEDAFWKEARSLKIGPHAYLIGYADDRYTEESLALAPGTIVADLDAIDFHAKVRSFKIICGDSDPHRAPQHAT